MARKVTWDEVKAHSSESNLWLVLHGKVYDVSGYISEHPGGEEVMLEQAGLDASQAFDDIGHSEDAKSLLKEYYVGDITGQKPAVSPKKDTKAPKPTTGSAKSSALFWLVSLLALFAAAIAGLTLYAPERLPQSVSAYIKQYVPNYANLIKEVPSKFGRAKPFPEKKKPKVKGKKAKKTQH